MNQSGYLHRLQRIDSQIDQTDARLAEIERLLSEDERVRAAKQAADDAKRALEKARLVLRGIEHNVTDTNIKIDQSNASLYSGSIRNPKELQDLEREIASLKNRLANLEEQELGAMIDQEEVEILDLAAQNQLVRIQAQVVEQKAGLAGERAVLQKNRQRLDAERMAAVPPISQPNLEVYARLREQKKGLAVSVVEDDTCGVCGSEVRPAESQSARLTNNLHFCKSCGRIMYAG
jgi:hypothetical protein